MGVGMTKYYQAVSELIKKIYENEQESISKAADFLVEAVKMCIRDRL